MVELTSKENYRNIGPAELALWPLVDLDWQIYVAEWKPVTDRKAQLTSTTW
jgi:hypothetical protein